MKRRKNQLVGREPAFFDDGSNRNASHHQGPPRQPSCHTAASQFRVSGSDVRGRTLWARLALTPGTHNRALFLCSLLQQVEFFANTFNSWLNMHRPCLFATEVVSDKGKIKKVYKHADVKTPLECLAQLRKKRLVTFKKGITLKDLEAQAREKTDLQAAQEMQTAKTALFAMFNKPEVKKRA